MEQKQGSGGGGPGPPPSREAITFFLRTWVRESPRRGEVTGSRCAQTPGPRSRLRPRPRPRPRPAARTWICPRVLLGEPGSTVGRLMQLMVPSGRSQIEEPPPPPPCRLAPVPAPCFFIPGARANREPAPPARSQSACGCGTGGRFDLSPPPRGRDRERAQQVQLTRAVGAAPRGGA